MKHATQAPMSTMHVTPYEAEAILRSRGSEKMMADSACVTESADEVLKRRIENDFSYHRPTEEMLPKFALLRGRGKELAHLIRELVPDGRERCIALTRLEEVIMHANAGIARRGSVER